MTALHLVRHGAPAVDYGVPPPRWELRADAAEALAEFAASGALPEGARWFSSPEPKALGTARSLTATSVTVHDFLGEAARPAGHVEDFDECVRRAFADPESAALPGWESYGAARRRIARGVRGFLIGTQGVPLVIVGHGVALTLLVAELTQTPPDMRAWQRLRMPDHCALDRAVPHRVASCWGSWRQ